MIAKYYANYILNRLNGSSSENWHSFNLNKSYSMPVLFDATDVNNIKIVKVFVYSYSSGKQIVSAIGYINDRNISFDHFSIL